MKRILLLMIAAALCAVGLAEEAPAPPVETVETVAFSEADAGYEGVWVPFEDGFALYLPAAWHSVEPTEAEAATGLFYRAGDATGEVAMAVAVGYIDARGIDGVDGLAGYFEDGGFARVRRRTLNGLPAVAFERPEDGFCGAAFLHPILPEYAMLVYVTPIGETADAILDSIRPRREGDAKGE